MHASAECDTCANVMNMMNMKCHTGKVGLWSSRTDCATVLLACAVWLYTIAYRFVQIYVFQVQSTRSIAIKRVHEGQWRHSAHP